MSSVKEYNKFYRLAYDFHARWFPFPDGSLNWEKCLDDVRKVSVENNDNPFLQHILLDVVDEMQRAYLAQILS